MNKIGIINEPEIFRRSIPGEKDYFEIIWKLSENPLEKWILYFEKQIKNYLESENPLFGPYKPKIFFDELVLTCLDEKMIEKQKDFFVLEIIEKVNQSFS